MTTKFFDLGECQISRDLAPCHTASGERYFRADESSTVESLRGFRMGDYFYHRRT